ncbi:MAG TPA: PAS domain S-box protein [Rectinemataceae bacterium]|nr:PAS domain S-box protein [Rectinemataceae bacterium]
MPTVARRLLLVEDEAIIALSEMKTLQSEGYEVVHVPSGEAAVDLVRGRTERFDLILMDIDLGRGMDGTQAAREILKEHDLPVVFLSSHTEHDLVERAEKITNYGYILKSAGATVLSASIRMALKLHAATMEVTANRDALRRSEEQYRSLVENIDAGILVVDLEDRFIYANPAAHGIFRMHGESLTGHCLGEFMDTENARIVGYQTDLRKRGLRSEYVFEILSSDGARRKVSVVATPRWDGETVIGTLAIIRDITELNAAEEALRRSEARFRLIFDNSPLAIALSTPEEGRIIDVNPAFCRTFAYEREELLGKTGLELGMWVEAEERLEVVSTLGGDSSGSGKVRKLRTHDGRLISARVYASLVTDWETPAVIFMVEDITETQNAQTMLRESEESLRRAEQLAGFGNWEFDLNGGTVRASSGAMSIYGLVRPDDLIKSVQKLPLPEYRRLLDEALEDLVAGRKPYDVRFKIRRPLDGRVVDIHSRAEYDAASRRIFGVIQDVSDAVRQEEASLRQESQYRELVANLYEGICIVDAEDRFVVANPAAHRIFGVAEGALVGARLDSFLDGENAAIVAGQTMNRRKGRLDEYRISIRTGEGRTKSIVVVASPRQDAQGRFIGTFAIVRDQSELDRAESERRRMESHYKFIFDNALTALLEEDFSALKQGLDELRAGGTEDLAEHFRLHPELVTEYARKVRITDANREYRELIGAASRDQVLSGDLTSLGTYNPATFGGQLAFLHAGHQLYEEDKRILLPSGEEKRAKMRLGIAPGHESDWARVVVSFIDLTEEQRALAELGRSLEQKDMLVRELEHRTKNNLGIISSLLSLEEQRIADPASKSFLRDMQARVQSVALIYELLSHGTAMETMDSRPYVEELLALLQRTHGFEMQGLRIRREILDIKLDTRHAVTLGLILNELLTNCIKYAFPQGRAGTVVVSLSRDGQAILLVVEDDGVGLPEGFDWRTANSLGLQLVDTLAGQLRGTMSLRSSQGLRVELRIPFAE